MPSLSYPIFEAKKKNPLKRMLNKFGQDKMKKLIISNEMMPTLLIYRWEGKKKRMGDNKNIKIERARQRFENDNKICKHKLNYKQNMKKKM